MDTNNDYVMDVCKLGQGAECCRYLTLGASTGWECAKNKPLGRILDERAKAGMMVARGDNCEGRDDLGRQQ